MLVMVEYAYHKYFPAILDLKLITKFPINSTDAISTWKIFDKDFGYHSFQPSMVLYWHDQNSMNPSS